jgi:hypothetical protein
MIESELKGMKLLIVARSHGEYEEFIRVHRIPHHQTIYVAKIKDIVGINPENPIIFVPGWWEHPQAEHISEAIDHHDLKHVITRPR